MLIYRVEHPTTNEGPFVMGEISLDNSRTHPTPWSEGLNIKYYDYCGCASMGMLQHWIKRKHIKNLKSKNYVVRTYKIDKNFVKHGRTQVLFEKLEAELIDTKCVSELYAGEKYW